MQLLFLYFWCFLCFLLQDPHKARREEGKTGSMEENTRKIRPFSEAVKDPLFLPLVLPLILPLVPFLLFVRLFFLSLSSGKAGSAGRVRKAAGSQSIQSQQQQPHINGSFPSAVLPALTAAVTDLLLIARQCNRKQF